VGATDDRTDDVAVFRRISLLSIEASVVEFDLLAICIALARQLALATYLLVALGGKLLLLILAYPKSTFALIVVTAAAAVLCEDTESEILDTDADNKHVFANNSSGEI
jgi:hypothetical protein